MVGTHETGGLSGMETYYAVWERGGSGLELPPDIGMRLPAPGAVFGLMVHYYYSDGPQVADRSGIRLCAVPASAVTHEAELLAFGASGSGVFPVQPGSQSFVGSCLADYTIGSEVPWDVDEVRIVAAWPHMRRFGTRMQVKVTRSEDDEAILIDEPFDRANHPFVPVDVGIQREDWIETTCWLDNPTEDTWSLTALGATAWHETCALFTVAYPPGLLRSTAGTFLPNNSCVTN